MSALDIPRSGNRAPEVLFTWEEGKFHHRVVRAHATNEWRAEKKRKDSKHFFPYRWFKDAAVLQEMKERAGL